MLTVAAARAHVTEFRGNRRGKPSGLKRVPCRHAGTVPVDYSVLVRAVSLQPEQKRLLLALRRMCVRPWNPPLLLAVFSGCPSPFCQSPCPVPLHPLSLPPCFNESFPLFSAAMCRPVMAVPHAHLQAVPLGSAPPRFESQLPDCMLQVGRVLQTRTWLSGRSPLSPRK